MKMIHIRRTAIYFLTAIISLVAIWSCQDDDNQFGTSEAPSNLQIGFSLVNADTGNEFGDGSGFVEFTSSADNAINFKYVFGDTQEALETNGDIIHTYSRNGVNTYTATVIASGRGGTQTSASVEVTVLSLFDDPVTRAFLIGDNPPEDNNNNPDATKTWYIASQEPGHLGVGGVNLTTPNDFEASPNQLAQCLYDDSITLANGLNGAITFNHDNIDPDGVGVTFFQNSFLSIGGGGGPADQCLPFDVSSEKFLSLSPATSGLPEDLTTGTQFSVTDGGFMAFYLNTSTYEVLEITENYMYVRVISLTKDGGPEAWYLKFTTNPDGSLDGGNGGPNLLETEYENLLFEEEFDVDGVPDPNTWNIEIGNGDNGWGNEELQYYTEDNVIVEDGILKITAKKEPTNGFDFSSTRMTTLDNFSYEYGRVEVRAKLPEGGGTWPAIWMLGENFPDVGWPETGEIDIMEHRGNQQDVIHGSLHLPGNSGGNAISESTTVAGVSQEFNNYTVEWSSERILFAVNDVVYHEFENTSGTPFNNPFFLILNVAMGGTFGGEVDPAFTESKMEVDYIRVYQ
jgi:hypothetical protein